VPDPAGILDLATRAALAAGALLIDRFGGPASGLEAKSTRTDLVSDADRASEDLLLGMIRAERPGDAILSEESGGGTGAGLSWVVDPLDGTINYLWGIPQWCVSVACQDREGGLVGVVHDPCRGETFRAVRGRGAWLGEDALTLGGGPPLGEALVGTGFGYDATRRRIQAERLLGVVPSVRDVRRAGSAALDLCWVACGRLDGYFEFGVQHWDWAAGAVVVRAAGGVVQEIPAGPEGAPGLLAAASGLAPDLRALVDAATPA
jgi:myo-inositol-1(or 4)-monophosphatase